jgi:DNA-binding transcriptional ArsR family regulator
MDLSNVDTHQKGLEGEQTHWHAAEFVTQNPDHIDEFFEVLNDPYARTIMEATVDRSRSAREIGEACNLSSSTVYRKLNTLTDLGLLDTHVEVASSGNHQQLYQLRLDSVNVSIAGDRLQLEVLHNE